MSDAGKQLLVLGCSATKRAVSAPAAAIAVYDGPAFRVLRAHVRAHRWPTPLSVAIVSAEHGLIGAMAPITPYDRRMTPARAEEIGAAITGSLRRLSPFHERTELVLGGDYMHALGSVDQGPRVGMAPGPIGLKLAYLSNLLRSMPCPAARVIPEMSPVGRPLYFLPDWDDFVDLGFNFERDKFSAPARRDRREAHASALTTPARMCDGILVSLAQSAAGRGMLRRVAPDSLAALAPVRVREHFALGEGQWAFGDCGAFSYVAEHKPVVGVEHAVAVYDLCEFDLGASVDHIPVETVIRDGKRVPLGLAERRRRVRLTRDNADAFLRLRHERSARFVPVGVIQGLSARDYGKQAPEYCEMGYQHLAIGGLVPRSDGEILDVVGAVAETLRAAGKRPWLHLLGVYRPALQPKLRALGVNSFDSATYFRKSWLRSDQNYLAANGKWYAAVRIPPSSDPRTLARLRCSGKSPSQILKMEEAALTAVRDFDRGAIGLEACLRVVDAYDRLLRRGPGAGPIAAYRKVLEARPWRLCGCTVCRSLGINVIVFRGLNRNKRRGAHNTLQLFKAVTSSASVSAV